jgi:hypothetical protein
MATTGGKGSLEESEIHDVLRNDRRRLTLDCLREAEPGEMSVRQLSEDVATLETGEDPAPRNKRQSVYVSLHQTHLPKLDDLGIVDYDSESKAVRLTDRIEEIEVYMEIVPQYGLSWGEYYLALATLGLLTTVGVLVGVPGVSSFGAGLVSAVFFLLFAASATYHVYSQQEGLPFSRLL